MAPKFSNLLTAFILLLSIIQPMFILSQARSLKPEGQTLNKFLQSLKEVQKGETVAGINEVKKHLKKFGYYPTHTILTDDFDHHLESALATYQKYYHLNVTGKLDSDTIKELMIPRCGVADITNQTFSKPSTSHNKFHMVSHYNFPNGMPKWPETKYALTYTFRSGVQLPNEQEMMSACGQAFQRWEGVSQFSFRLASADEQADIVIGFHSGEHGDEEPFDGPGNVLAHSFSPQDGRFHYDADEDWSSNPNMNQIDLESVAVHEIGHLLGLAHSQDANAIMYAKIPPGTIKRDLTQDDVDGIRALYNQ